MSIQSIFLNTGVLIAVIGTITSIVIASMNNSKLTQINKEKLNGEFLFFRYEKLYSIFEKLQDYSKLQAFPNDSDKTFWSGFENSEKIHDLYKLALPLIDRSLQCEIEQVYKDLSRTKEIMNEAVQKNNLEVINQEKNDWQNLRNTFINKFNQVLQEQISILTNIGS